MNDERRRPLAIRSSLIIHRFLAWLHDQFAGNGAPDARAAIVARRRVIETRRSQGDLISVLRNVRHLFGCDLFHAYGVSVILGMEAWRQKNDCSALPPASVIIATKVSTPGT